MAEDFETVDCSVDDVRDKYTVCGTIVNGVMAETLAGLKPGASALEICQTADADLHQRLNEVYNKKKSADGEAVPRGVAFPTCLNINECVRHFCPLEDNTTTLKDGDVVTVEMGGHIDGFLSTAAHTVVVGEGPVTGKTADVVLAAWKALEVAARSLKPQATNVEVSAAINKVVSEYECNVVSSMVSYELKQHVIDGAKCILPRPGTDEKQPPCTFAQFEVYALNIFVSSGEGKPRESGDRPTIFRREISVSTLPKSQAGRALIEEINRKSPCLPFAARSVGDPKTRRMALTEGQRTGTLAVLPTLYERSGDVVAHFGCTLMLTKVPRRIAGEIALKEEERFQSEKSIKDEELVKLLQRRLK